MVEDSLFESVSLALSPEVSLLLFRLILVRHLQDVMRIAPTLLVGANSLVRFTLHVPNRKERIL